jgi:hypothetical protein
MSIDSKTKLISIGINMTYLDKTYCASPDCTNECGRKMPTGTFPRTSFERQVKFGYFCGEPEIAVGSAAEEWSKNFVEKNKELLKRIADK